MQPLSLSLRIALTLSFFLRVCAGQAFSNGTNQQQTQWCDYKSGMCMAINIPSTTAPDYYLSITAPQSVGWAAVGIGSQMPHSLMFVISQYNGNVTLSVRLAQGHSEPAILKNVTATLERGTGVNNSYITANIHVQKGGYSWGSGGSLVSTNTAQNFIYAFSPNVPSGGASGNLKQHVSVGSFSLDLTQAIGTGGMPVITSPETNWGWNTIVLAHAVIMGLVWVGALPAGAIIIRFLNQKVPNPVDVHRILQLTSLVFVFIAFFIGVGASSGQNFQFAHQWFGLLIFLGLFAQAVLGWYHHKRFEEDKPTTRRWFTHAHLWLGRILLFFALINIGLGIQLYGDGAAAQAVWYLITVAAVGTYAFFYWHGHVRRRKQVKDAFDPSPFEDQQPLEDNAGERPYTTYAPVNVGVMSDNDLGTYRVATAQSRDSQEYYDPIETGYTDHGAIPPTITAVNRPGTSVRPSTSAIRPPTSVRPLNRPPTSAIGPMGGRQYDTSTQVISGPYSPTEPLRTNPQQPPPQQDPFEDPVQSSHRPRTGRATAPYPVSTVSHQSIPVGRAPAYPQNDYGTATWDL